MLLFSAWVGRVVLRLRGGNGMLLVWGLELSVRQCVNTSP